MAKLIVDTIQRPGGTGLTLPLADGASGSFVKTDGAGNLSFGTGFSYPPAPPVAVAGKETVGTSTTKIVGSLVSHTDRQNNYSTGQWTSSGPWTTYYNYTAHTDNSLIQFVNMALGDGMGASGSSQYMYGNDSESEISRQLEFSNGKRLGYMRDSRHWNNSTGNAGHTFRIMPIRNTSSDTISVNAYGYVSDYWSQGYEGTCLFTLTPNTGLYSGVTTVSSNRISYTQTNTGQTSLSGSFNIPGNTTVLLCLASTDCYQTTYKFNDTNYFYNLDTTFGNSNIICDMRMLTSLYQTRFNLPYTGAAENTALLAPLWTKTATNYGDR